MSSALRVENLWKSYSAGVRGCSVRVWALRGCTLHVDRGERVGIVGRRGAGKTTLIRCLRGELRSDAGRIDRTGSLTLIDDEAHAALARRLDGAVVITSRDVASIQGMVDRILLLRDGRLTPLVRPAVRRVAERVIGPPGSVRLIR